MFSIIVLEPSGGLRDALATERQRRLPGRTGDGTGPQGADEIVEVVSATTAEEAMGWHRDLGGAVLVADIGNSVAETLGLLGSWDRRCPVVVVGESRWSEWEWPLREAGVTEILVEPVTPMRLFAVCQRAARTTASPESGWQGELRGR